MCSSRFGCWHRKFPQWVVSSLAVSSSPHVLPPLVSLNLFFRRVCFLSEPFTRVVQATVIASGFPWAYFYTLHCFTSRTYLPRNSAWHQMLLQLLKTGRIFSLFLSSLLNGGTSSREKICNRCKIILLLHCLEITTLNCWSVLSTSLFVS